MIMNPTVLILGAGASHPYGYPLGSSLVEEIVRLTVHGSPLAEVLREPQLDVFHRRLRESETYSIDEFLECNPDFLEIGKLCIAAGLMMAGPVPSTRVAQEHHWYRYLWARLREGAAKSSDFRDNRLSVITYNYEMSLERYLARVLANSFPDLAQSSPEAVTEFATQAVPIVHLHGTLSGADGLAAAENDRGKFMTREFLDSAARGIRVVHEEITGYRVAHERLGLAGRVHILGFGYHSTNLQRLELLRVSKEGNAWGEFGGTAMGLGAAQRRRAANGMKLGRGLLYDLDCLAYLKEYALLD
jgi:hypothetical protein